MNAMAKAAAVMAALLAIAPYYAVRLEADSEISVEADADVTMDEAFLVHNTFLMDSTFATQGTECNDDELKLFKDRFQLGKTTGRTCSDPKKWASSDIEYANPSVSTLALYLYPFSDHNNAFGFCTDDKKFDRVVCKRLLAQSNFYSVRFLRIGYVTNAIAKVEALDPSTKIQHLVLGGHGQPTSLQWKAHSPLGELSVNNAKTNEFLDAVKPHLEIGAEGSTVLLDACLNGKPVAETNLVQYIAHRLAGVHVFGSRISWDNSQFNLIGTGERFDATIMHKGDQMVSVRLGEGPLRDWKMFGGRTCDDKGSEPAIPTQKISECRQLCEDTVDCAAFVWFPAGNAGKANKKCYLSPLCTSFKDSTKGAMSFKKP